VKEAIACLKLSRHNLAQGRLLDLGCGSGYLLRYLEKKGINVVGLEINRKRLRIAKMINLDSKLILGDGLKLPLKDNRFHTVILNDVLEHVPYRNAELLLREIWRVLDQKGKLYISVSNKYQIKEPHTLIWFLTWLPRKCYVPILRKIRQPGNLIYPYTSKRLKEVCGNAGFTFDDYTWFYARKKIIEISYIGDPLLRKIVTLLGKLHISESLFKIAAKFSMIIFVCEKR
jgi:ubiquinone/menaquinone biosynthesis C-methylase UbiE